MEPGALGKTFRAGDVILREGEAAACMYVIQEGRVEVSSESGGKRVPLAVLGERDFFGEMALFERDVRSATVRALEDVRILTLDRQTFLRRVQEDPSLAFRILERLSHRIREMDVELARLKSAAETFTEQARG